MDNLERNYGEAGQKLRDAILKALPQADTLPQEIETAIDDFATAVTGVAETVTPQHGDHGDH